MHRKVSYINTMEIIMDTMKTIMDTMKDIMKNIMDTMTLPHLVAELSVKEMQEQMLVLVLWLDPVLGLMVRGA